MFVVAGVTGHVGSLVAQGLLAKGQKVKALVREAHKGAPWAEKGAEVAVGGLDDQAFLAKALRGAQGFFALLPPNYAVKSDFYGAQRRTADQIAAAVKESGIPHVVLLSSVGADLEQGNGPIKALYHLENALRATGAKLSAIRSGYFQENIGGSIAPAKSAGVFPNFVPPSADQPFPMVATKDIAPVVVESLLAPPAKSEVVDLLGPLFSKRQLAEKLGAALGQELKIVDVPRAEWVPAMIKSGMSQELAEAFAEMYDGFVTGALRPKGDRSVQTRTGVDEVIKALV